MRTVALDSAPQVALRDCSKAAGEKVSVEVILVKGEYMQSSRVFLQNVSASHKEQSSPWRILVFFRYEEIQELGSHKVVSWKYLTIWRPVLPVFPWAQSTLFLFSTLNSFRQSRKSAAATVDDLILMEIDGKWHFVADLANISFRKRSRLILGIQARLASTL